MTWKHKNQFDLIRSDDALRRQKMSLIKRSFLYVTLISPIYGAIFRTSCSAIYVSQLTREWQFDFAVASYGAWIGLVVGMVTAYFVRKKSWLLCGLFIWGTALLCSFKILLNSDAAFMYVYSALFGGLLGLGLLLLTPNYGARQNPFKERASITRRSRY